MDKKNKRNINNTTIFRLLAIGFVFGAIVVFLYFQPHLTYQGKSAQEWSDIAGTKEQDAKKWELMYNTTISELKDLQNKPVPTPTTVTQYATPSDELPPYCYPLIDAWMKAGYSRSATNRMLKKNNPECAY